MPSNEAMQVDETPRFHAERPIARKIADGSALNSISVVVPGGNVDAAPGYVRGHGTRVCPETGLRSTLAGVVERVNKLVAVRALRSRYQPEVGDVVVGRVLSVRQRRWGVDIGATAEATLLLSAVTLPGGLQRRRTHQDELNMRAFFAEGDLLSAEIQELGRHDGAAVLHTRSSRYGRLSRGALVVVQAALVQRAKKHFHTLSCGVRAILGNNGFVFLDFPLEVDQKSNSEEVKIGTEPEHRQQIARVANAIRVLDRQFIAISPTTIEEVYRSSVRLGVDVVQMLRDDVARQVCKGAMDLREQA